MKEMRVIVMAGLFVLLHTLVASAGCITVVSPNGGEVLPMKTKHMIKWQETCTKPFQVKIFLKNSSGFRELIGSVTVTSSLSGMEWFEWEVGKLLNGGYAQPGNDYKIVLKIAGDPAQIDRSDNFFSITAPNMKVRPVPREYRKFVPPNEPVTQPADPLGKPSEKGVDPGDWDSHTGGAGQQQ